MTNSQLSEVIQHLCTTVLLPDGAGLTDGRLLESFITQRDAAAMEVLVRRHGPMVWGVCRRVLHDHHDAEDAFQATFLVFVRRAASIASRELLANWLYGVARQTALKARATAAKRKGRERQVTAMPEPAAAESDLWDDLQPLLDQELSRLPDKYRAVIVLCDLEGKARQEVAVQLKMPEGTVASRLARARAMLAKRLTQRGITLPGGALAAVLAQQAVSAGVPTSVMSSTIKAANLYAAGQAGVISAKVAGLTEGVLKAMLLTKLKPTLAALLLVVSALSAYGVSSLGARGDMDNAERKSQGPAPGFVPAPEGPVPPVEQVVVKAVYFVGNQGGDLSVDDLKKHPEVKTVHTFADLQRLAAKKVAVWIDLTALPLLQGDKEMEWVIRRNAEGYPFAMIGCNEFLWCFREKLDCFGISGPGPIDWTKYELSPGFSVICQRREKVGVEVHATGEGLGYKVVPTVQKVLNVTDRLLAGEAAPETP